MICLAQASATHRQDLLLPQPGPRKALRAGKMAEREKSSLTQTLKHGSPGSSTPGKSRWCTEKPTSTSPHQDPSQHQGNLGGKLPSTMTRKGCQKWVGRLGQTSPMDTEVKGYDRDSRQDTVVIMDFVAPSQITSPHM